MEMFLLDVRYQYFVYFIIFLFFVGNEAVIVAVIILNVQIAPSEQQARASGLISFGNSIINFISILIAGPIYSYGGMNIEAILLLVLIILECAGIMCFYIVDLNETKSMVARKSIRNSIDYKPIYDA